MLYAIILLGGLLSLNSYRVWSWRQQQTALLSDIRAAAQLKLRLLQEQGLVLRLSRDGVPGLSPTKLQECLAVKKAS